MIDPSPVELFWWSISIAIMIVTSYRVGMGEKSQEVDTPISGPIMMVGAIVTICVFLYSICCILSIASKAFL